MIQPAAVIWPFQYIIVRSSFPAAAGHHGHHHRHHHGAHDRAEDESRADDACRDERDSDHEYGNAAGDHHPAMAGVTGVVTVLSAPCGL